VSAALIVRLVWRSQIRYALRAATLSAAALIATPYAFAYDMAAIAIPVAFLVKDQIGYGMLRGEQTTRAALFGATEATLVVLETVRSTSPLETCSSDHLGPSRCWPRPCAAPFAAVVSRSFA
jgi:hypothetical protein